MPTLINHLREPGPHLYNFLILLPLALPFLHVESWLLLLKSFEYLKIFHHDLLLLDLLEALCLYNGVTFDLIRLWYYQFSTFFSDLLLLKHHLFVLIKAQTWWAARTLAHDVTKCIDDGVSTFSATPLAGYLLECFVCFGEVYFSGLRVPLTRVGFHLLIATALFLQWFAILTLISAFVGGLTHRSTSFKARSNITLLFCPHEICLCGGFPLNSPCLCRINYRFWRLGQTWLDSSKFLLPFLYFLLNCPLLLLLFVISATIYCFFFYCVLGEAASISSDNLPLYRPRIHLLLASPFKFLYRWLRRYRVGRARQVLGSLSGPISWRPIWHIDRSIDCLA